MTDDGTEISQTTIYDMNTHHWPLTDSIRRNICFEEWPRSRTEVSSNPKSIWLMKCISFTEIAIRFNRISLLFFFCRVFEACRPPNVNDFFFFLCVSSFFSVRSTFFSFFCWLLSANVPNENGHQNDERIIYAISTAIFGIYFCFFFLCTIQSLEFGMHLARTHTQLLLRYAKD